MEERRWHASYPPGFPHEIQLDEQQTLVTLMERAFRAHAERAAASCLDETLRYADLDRLSGTNLVLSIDVTGLDVGAHSVTATANLTTGLTLISASPNLIDVTVSRPAPSPAPS